MANFMKSRGMEEDMAEDRYLWRLGVDGRLLAVYVYIVIFSSHLRLGLARGLFF